MTAKDIASIIGKDRVLAGHVIVCENVNHLFLGQQDVISVNKSGLVIEYEIKISRNDFKREAKKKREFNYTNPQWFPGKVPNQMYYVVPIGLIERSEVPSWAGLMYIADKGIMYSVKKAPILTDHKHDLVKILKKVTTLYQQREFLGCCLLTYQNKGIKERNKARLKQYEDQRAINTQALLDFKKK